MIVIQRQNMAGRNRVIGTCFNTVVRITAVIAQVGTPVEVGEADVAQLAAPGRFCTIRMKRMLPRESGRVGPTQSFINN